MMASIAPASSSSLSDLSVELFSMAICLSSGGTVGLPCRPGLVGRALQPVHAGEIDPVLVHQHAADPDRSRHGVERNADTLAGKVFGAAYDVAVHGDEAVPEHARGKNRQRDERTGAGAHAADEFRRGEFGSVELQPARHTVEGLARVCDRNEIELDAGRPHFAGQKRHHAVIGGAGKRDGQGGHDGHSRWHGGCSVPSRTRAVKTYGVAQRLRYGMADQTDTGMDMKTRIVRALGRAAV